jgi:hypothetical protein
MRLSKDERRLSQSTWILESDIDMNDLIIQEEEVAVSWAKPEKILEMVHEGLFYNYGTSYFRAVFGETKEAEGSFMI